MANKYEKYSLKQNPYKKKSGKYSGNSLYYSCIKKRKYRSEKKAEEKITEIFFSRGVNLRSYVCDFCGYHHITKKANR